MGLINEISHKLLFSPHHCPHIHSCDASPFIEAQQTQPGPLDHRIRPLYGQTRLMYMGGQDYGFMALINEISWKFPLFSPHRCPHTYSLDVSPYTEAQQTQPAPLDYRIRPLYERTRLYGFMALINEISRKFPLFSTSPPPTHSWDPFPFTEAQRTQLGLLDHITHPLNGRTRRYGLNSRKLPLFSPHHRPPHTFSGHLTFHQGTTNPIRSVRPQDTHP